jgi:hypothetical protein
MDFRDGVWQRTKYVITSEVAHALCAQSTFYNDGRTRDDQIVALKRGGCKLCVDMIDSRTEGRLSKFNHGEQLTLRVVMHDELC